MTITKTETHMVLQQAIEFTDTYKVHREAHPALREAAVLRTQYPALMGPIRPGDWFAGARAEGRICYMDSIWWTTMAHEQGPSKQGGYCFDFGALDKYDFSEEEKAQYLELKDFWREEYTCAKTQRYLDADQKRYASHGQGQISGGEACGFCVAVDLDRLVQRGIPGLMSDIDVREVRARENGEGLEFIQGLREALLIVIDVCKHYEKQAREMLETCDDANDKARLEQIAESLSAIVKRKPETLHEASQLLWIYDIIVSGLHIEAWRIDVALGDFFAKDIDSGRLTEEEATQMVLGLWKMWERNGDPAVCRMIIGGKGRRNPENADRFCIAAMEASRRNHWRIPQLTLRFDKEQNPALMKKAFDVIGDGCVFPMLYNDDVLVPGVAEALNVPEDEAVYYNPLGCGEYMLAAKSPSLLNFSWSAPKTIEAALHGGVGQGGTEMGPKCDPIDDASTWDDLQHNIKTQIDFSADLAGRIHVQNAKVLGQECAFLFASLLTDDCLERGKSLLDGGVQYVGGCIMGHGFTNAADALHAIRQLVYEEKAVTISQLKDALASNFEGYEDIHKRLLNMPKFGNDDDGVDREVSDLWRMMTDGCAEAGKKYGLDFLTISSVNPGGYFLGMRCGAGADGRLAGTPFAIGNAPTAGNDKKGLTALFNSLSKVDPVNGGTASNIKLAKSLFTEQREKLEVLFDVYWKRGGMQASVSVVDQEELKDAMEHPERYPHLLVRLGGWTAKFVELERHEQEEIIRRSIY